MLATLDRGDTVLVPFAAHLAPEGQQGKVISTVMSGLLIGVLGLRALSDASGVTNFTWDARNRLVALNGPGTSGSFAYGRSPIGVDRPVPPYRETPKSPTGLRQAEWLAARVISLPMHPYLNAEAQDLIIDLVGDSNLPKRLFVRAGQDRYT